LLGNVRCWHEADQLNEALLGQLLARSRPTRCRWVALTSVT